VKNNSTSVSVAKIVVNALLTATLTVFVIILLMATYLYYVSFQWEQLKNQILIHDTISTLIKPSIILSDTVTVEHLLGLVSKDDNIFGVIDSNGNIILSDYNEFDVFKSLLNSISNSSNVSCEALSGKKVDYLEKKYTVFCSVILGDDNNLSDNTKKIPQELLISLYSSRLLIFTPKLFIYFIVLSIILLTGIAFLIRLIIHRKILNPLILLKNQILENFNKPLVKTHPLIENNNFIPLEIFQIKIIFEKLLENLQIEYKKREEYTKQIALGQISAQVAHDIRSPLAALNSMTVKELASIPEAQRNTIRNTINRINDIANNLLTKYKTPNASVESDKVSPEHIVSLLDSIVSEKRAQYADKAIEFILDIETVAQAAFAKVNAIEFKRALSNLINNSVEALHNTGNIRVALRKRFGSLDIEVIDNGCGISEDLLPQIINGLSVGKEDGHGLGLSYTVACIKAWEGEYHIDSKVGVGTTFEISLPLSQPADWFFSKLTVLENSTILVLDDDELIHEIWQRRFKDALWGYKNITVKHFRSPIELLNYCNEYGVDNTHFLIDYELIGHSLTGLDVIKELNISEQAALVTSRYDDLPVKTAARALGVKIIPKGFAVHIPINVMCLRPDLILIDDSEILTDSWYHHASRVGKQIATFNKVSEFMAVRHYYPLTTPLYIDSELGQGVKGEELAKTLFDEGFTIIYLATGFNKHDFPVMPWIKEVVGKDAPF